MRFGTVKESNKYPFLLSCHNRRYEITIPSHKNNLLNRMFDS